MNIYLVGGCVRDKFLGKEPKDIDYAVEAESFEAMRNYLINDGAKIYLEKPEYLTIRAKHKNVDADFVLCRNDGLYKDGRRPESTSIGTIYEDLARRDFCCNSISINIKTNELLDPFNGRQDIQDKIIRCTGSVERLSEDYLRMLRAIRFAITLGFKLDDEIMVYIDDNWKLLKEIAVERIVDELNKAFTFNMFETIDFLRNNFKPELSKWLFTHPEIFMKLAVRKEK